MTSRCCLKSRDAVKRFNQDSWSGRCVQFLFTLYIQTHTTESKFLKCLKLRCLKQYIQNCKGKGFGVEHIYTIITTLQAHGAKEWVCKVTSLQASNPNFKKKKKEKKACWLKLGWDYGWGRKKGRKKWMFSSSVHCLLSPKTQWLLF